MSIRTILAAALAAGAFAVPAVASDFGTSTIPTKQVEFYSAAQPPRLVEGRNSDRAAVVTNRVQAATSQGFAPIDVEALLLRSSNR
jgi:hypothetical protein